MNFVRDIKLLLNDTSVIVNLKELKWIKKNKTISISDVDYGLNPASTILGITLMESVNK